MPDPTEEEAADLEKKLIAFIQSSRKTEQAYLKFNAQVLTKIIQHHANALNMSFKDVLDHCNNMRDWISVEALRKSLVSSR